MFFDTLTILRASLVTDRAGNTVSSWANPQRIIVDKLNIQPSVQQEHVDSQLGQGVYTGFRVQSEPGTAPDVRSDDRAEFGGRVFEVEGEIAKWSDPLTGGAHHVEFNLRVWAGR